MAHGLAARLWFSVLRFGACAFANALTAGRFSTASAHIEKATQMLGWNSQAGVGIVTVRQVEAGDTEPRRSTLNVIRQAFERAGVEFIDENGGGPGLRLRKRPPAKPSKR